jgi:spoIIIJ-associated protein
MQWIEITAPSVEEAKQQALEHLGIGEDEAEFDVVAEPTKGLFGKMRGEARVRARVLPKGPRPKAERRDRRKKGKDQTDTADQGDSAEHTERGEASPGREEPAVSEHDQDTTEVAERPGAGARTRPAREPREPRGERPSRPERSEPADPASLEQQAAAAQAFVAGLVASVGLEGSTTVAVVDGDIEVDVQGEDLGLLIGPRGQVLLAVQELARVAAAREVDGRPARLRVDVSSYWRKRHEALARFAVKVAGEVAATGVARALEAMSAPDRKVVHDAVGSVEGVSTRSEGEDPHRRVVITPA